MRQADGKYKLKPYTVYMHISPNNKYYIGITCQDLQSRWGGGNGYKNQKLFYRAIQKYGWDSFTHAEIISDLSLEDACLVERILIRTFQSNNPAHGYNCTDGGEGISGYHLTAEQIENRRIAAIGRRHTQETKDKLSKLKTGSKLNLSDEQRAALSERARQRGYACKGRKLSKQALENIRNGINDYYKNGGKPHHCMPHSEETKRKISESSKGKVVSEETREKLRQAALKQWQRQKQIK